ncbi:DUF349 domain-containing protein [Pseudolabrys taiwanensis]|uniref:DUF349 domain-containing protein n=1 Tax=Pseudolabrys taiwanensis TaxID=331696 RepID=A0A346A2D3_9HYPH|nr:DUF349 domain-containing protein [Pseudolabrys taiwanensis]AXK83330.1 DUF349 domain-containing protein [Pseudolabrys taiwanensis]
MTGAYDRWHERQAVTDEMERIARSDYDTREEWEEAQKDILELKDQWHAIRHPGKFDEDGDQHRRMREALDDFFEGKRKWLDDRRAAFEAAADEKRSIVEAANDLLRHYDLRDAREKYKELQAEWKEIRGGDPDSQLWNEFRSVGDEIYSQTEERRQHFDNASSLKRALVKSANDLPSWPDSRAAKEKYKGLQAEWKGIRGGDPDSQLWNEFRSIGDQLFAKSNARQNDNANNAPTSPHSSELERLELTSKMKELALSDDPKSKTAEAIKLQKRWKSLAATNSNLSVGLARQFRQAEEQFWAKVKSSPR